MNKKKTNLIVLFFLVGFLSLALMGFVDKQLTDTIPDTTVNIEDVINKEFDESLHTDTVDDNSGNILNLERQSGFRPVSIIRGIFGIIVLILISFIFSSNRKKINWGVVGKGLALQLLLALGVLYVPFIESAFDFIGKNG